MRKAYYRFIVHDCDGPLRVFFEEGKAHTLLEHLLRDGDEFAKVEKVKVVEVRHQINWNAVEEALL
jgi:hypothetical protein